MLYSIKDLLLNMPQYLDLDAHAANALTLTYNGTSATVTIQTKTLTTSVAGGTGGALSVNLGSYTISSLVTYLNSQTGYTASLTSGANGSSSAISLIEVIAAPIIPTMTLQQFTAPNWLFWMPLLWQLQQAQIDLASGLNEMYLAVGDGGFLDFWGNVYGGITRDSGETDNAYAERIAQEVVRPRLTGLALEQAVYALLGGVSVSISGNLSDVALKWSAGAWNTQTYVTFPFYPTIFTVDAPGGVDEALVSPVIERNRAAGIEPIYNYTASARYSNLAVNPWFPIYPVKD